MSHYRPLLAIATLLLATSASLAAPAPAQSRLQATRSPNAAESVYVPGSQYTATLDQTRNQWRMQPLKGQDVVIQTGACATGTMVSPGVWLLVSDRHGRLELLAPSVTRLPAGGSDRIALRACDQASGRELAVPQTVLDLLAANTGAIYVEN